jgi:hypothetical protein
MVMHSEVSPWGERNFDGSQFELTVETALPAQASVKKK